ncbi:MAG TPA: hypothetical protein PLX89_26775 [Verrucomicrobiota bacterium]|nr:hypothetical protein [Verrucomicrobiales bacterium]HRI16612.1 hypothetical protein [Verrucomicrobiota bacterium]
MKALILEFSDQKANRRSSERESADSLKDECNATGGWLSSLTFAFGEMSTSPVSESDAVAHSFQDRAEVERSGSREGTKPRGEGAELSRVAFHSLVNRSASDRPMIRPSPSRLRAFACDLCFLA